MKVNQNLAIVGEKVVLVPYRKEHVEKYHEWMLDPELRELTASEPLSLEEEYEMQKKWQEDEDKLTFIILARDGSAIKNDLATIRKYIYDTSRMIGDVNLFFKGWIKDEESEVEVEIMIAEKCHRRNGFAFEALQLLLSFATSFSHSSSPLLPISADKLVARVGEKNVPSLALFEKLGFVMTKRVEVFEEIELRLRNNLKRKAWRKGAVIELDME